MTWEELWQKVLNVSYFFNEQLGNKHQEVVDILLTNSIDFVITYLAILQSGHIALPIDPAYKKLEIDAIIKQVPPKLIITSQRYIDNISDQSKVILVDNMHKKYSKSLNPFRTSAKKQVASLTFTSGTSGRPKAVPNTHANHIWNIKACSKVWRWNSEDSLLISLPLSHMHGLVIGLSGVIYHGNTMYLQQQGFDPENILNLLASKKITMFTHVPLAYMKLLNYEPNKKYDLSGVRICISGAAPLSPVIWQQFKDRFGVEIVETYGSSETGRIAGNELGKKMLGSPGKPLPGVNLKLSTESEVLVKSPGVFPGYWHNKSATNASITRDGYWRTGDLGELKDGYIFLKGRLQEKIRRFGYSISPRDVEWAMQQNPKIREIHVIGQQSSGLNDLLIYFVVTDLSEQAIKAYCKQNLLFAWRPDKIIHLKEIPRTRNGKPQIKYLQEMLA